MNYSNHSYFLFISHSKDKLSLNYYIKFHSTIMFLVLNYNFKRDYSTFTQITSDTLFTLLKLYFHSVKA